MKDFEHLTDEQLLAQIEEDQQREKQTRDEAIMAEREWRGKMAMNDIVTTRLNDQFEELRRRKHAARTT